MRNEAQTRRDLIDPKLFLRGWTNELIKVEQTPGGTDILPDGTTRKRAGRSDYLLCLKIEGATALFPVAVIEAKKENDSPNKGLLQAQGYAKRFNVPFCFSTNGIMYSEFAEDTNEIKEFASLNDFPTPTDLLNRYQAFKNIQLQSQEAKALLMKYRTGESTRFYYQDAAIRAVLEKIAQGEKKVLLCLATGTGKTFIAKELFYKLSQAGQIRRALFLIDRDELRTQALSALQGVFGDDAQEVSTSNPNTNAKILIATYHTLNVADENKDPVFWKENFPPDFFSHIVIDECHRSAWGKWSIILKDNPNAIHIGLTATPRTIVTKEQSTEIANDEAITANNITYFGEPVYEYSIADGQNDGFLAACEVIKQKADVDLRNIDKTELINKNLKDAFSGNKVEEAEIEDIYSPNDFERKLVLDDRINTMCGNLFSNLLQTGSPHQKTIIFCVSEYHAEKVAIVLHNIYTQWCKTNGVAPKENYAFKCTAQSSNPSSKELIAELKGSSNSHFIATTVELLSTGVDVPNLNNVVFFKYIKSPISFYQMVGRGTRIGDPRGSKMMFRLYDYTNATRLFGADFISKPAPLKKEDDGSTTHNPIPRKIIRVAEQQFEITIQDQGKSILCQEDGVDVLVPYETYKQNLATAITDKVNNLDILKQNWINPLHRKELLQQLPGGEGAVRLVRELEEEQECDLYDVLAQLGFGYLPKTREERASGFGFRNKEWLKAFPTPTQKTLTAIALQFAKGGIEEMETENLFDVDEVKNNGGIEALYNLPNQAGYYINETKMRLLA